MCRKLWISVDLFVSCNRVISPQLVPINVGNEARRWLRGKEERSYLKTEWWQACQVSPQMARSRGYSSHVLGPFISLHIFISKSYFLPNRKACNTLSSCVFFQKLFTEDELPFSWQENCREFIGQEILLWVQKLYTHCKEIKYWFTINGLSHILLTQMVGATETMWFLWYINNSIVWRGINNKRIHFVKLFYCKKPWTKSR